MNQTQPYMDVHSHMSSAQSYPPQGATAGAMSTTSTPATTCDAARIFLHPGWLSAVWIRPWHYFTRNRTSTKLNGWPNAGSVAAVACNHAVAPPSGYGNNTGAPLQGFVFDGTGQVAPPGAKPRVTATLWEDEGSLCYQVEAKGVCVARREDNHMINGTKLLNVAGMTRGRRDGILKSEKLRHVVKIGPMHLKGVWIPFERALEFANKEKITDLLYPLFVHNIGGLLYHPANQTRTNIIVQESQERRLEGRPSGPQRTPSGSQQPPIHHHHPSLQTPMSSHVSQGSISGQPGSRPGLERANTFPTPPASASSLVGTIHLGSTYEWGVPVPHTQPLSIDTTLSNQRSMPTTPATTPPGNNMHGLPAYPSHGYDSTKPYYSAAPQTHAHPARWIHEKRHGATKPTPAAEPESSERDPNRYSQSSGPGETVPEHEQEYMPDHNTGYNSNRGSYTFSTNPSVSSLTGEHSQLTPEMTSSPSQQNGSGRMTPRTGSGPPHWASGYNTPPRPAAAATLYNAVSDTRGTPATGASDPYSMASTTPPVYTTGNGLLSAGSKRMRDDDDIRPESTVEYETSKRRKTITDATLGGPVGGPPILQPMKPSVVVARHR
ncbi:hypothetical protein PDIDSM_1121 [Penicillium digitatum]|nr:hypothetical protein PDIDSM_1121 [Penicillium digitatum]